MAFINMIIVVIGLTLASSSSASACEKAIFLLAGQSNMVGLGGTYTPMNKWDERVPEQCKANPRILRLNSDMLWDEAKEPLHKGEGRCPPKDRIFGVGPGMPFANALLALLHPPAGAIGTIGLVPCAVGGTSISEWSRGRCLYERLLVRARASLRDGGGGALRGILWYQGEADAVNEDDAEMYEGRLAKFFNDVRQDLMSPSLPIIQVALALPQGRLVKQVRRAQLGLKLPNVTCVDAAGLPLNGDNVHLTTDAQVQLGTMLADAYSKYLN